MTKVILHNAISLDSKVDGFSADNDLYYGKGGTWKENAILIGSDTFLNNMKEIDQETPDDLKSNDKTVEKMSSKIKKPVLLVPDSQGRVRFWHMFKKWGYFSDYIALCSQATPQDYLDYLNKRNIKFLICGDIKVYYKKAFGILEKDYGISTIRVDSGGTLGSILLDEGLVDELSLLVHPVIVGGTAVLPFYKNLNNIKLKLISCDKVADGILWLKYSVQK